MWACLADEEAGECWGWGLSRDFQWNSATLSETLLCVRLCPGLVGPREEGLASCPRGRSSRRASREPYVVWGQLCQHRRPLKDVRSVPLEHCKCDFCSQFPGLMSGQQSPHPFPAIALNKNLIKKNPSRPMVPKGDLWACARLPRLPQTGWGKGEQCGECFMKWSLCALKGLLCILRLSSYILVGAHEIGTMVEDKRRLHGL